MLSALRQPGSFAFAALLCGALAACGGDDGDATPPTGPGAEQEAGGDEAKEGEQTVPPALEKIAPPPLPTDSKALETPRGRAAERVASQGRPAPVLAEPELVIKRATPKALLGDALQMVLAGEDIAALARLSRSKADRPQLTEDDAADARRRFLSPSMKVYWQKINKAVRAGSYKVVEDGDEAEVLVDVGGAAGTYRVRLRKEGDAWYLAD